MVEDLGALSNHRIPYRTGGSLDGGMLSPQGSVWLDVCGAPKQDVGLKPYSRHRPTSRSEPTDLIWLWV